MTHLALVTEPPRQLGARSPGALRVRTDWLADGTYVVFVGGEVDLSTASALTASLVGEMLDRARSIVVDLSTCTFIDASGLIALVDANERLCASETSRTRGSQDLLASSLRGERVSMTPSRSTRRSPQLSRLPPRLGSTRPAGASRSGARTNGSSGAASAWARSTTNGSSSSASAAIVRAAAYSSSASPSTRRFANMRRASRSRRITRIRKSNGSSSRTGASQSWRP